MTAAGDERDGREAMAAFLGALEARDASVHTRRAYGTALEQYLDWLDGVSGVDLAPAAAPDAARLPRRARRTRPVTLHHREPCRRPALLLPLRSATGLGQRRSLGGHRDAPPIVAAAARPRGGGRRAAPGRASPVRPVMPWAARGATRSRTPSSCATAPSWRSPTRPGCASARSPPRGCRTWIWPAARSACSARAARNAWACSVGQRVTRWMPTCATGGRSSRPRATGRTPSS